MPDPLTCAVVIPSIPGREKMLGRALASVAEQTRAPEQIIVEHDPHRTGAAATRNRALGRVTSDVVCWLDDDDEFLPLHVERLMRAMEKFPQFGLVYPIPLIPEGRDPTATAVDGAWVPPWGVPFGPEQEDHLINQGSFIPITHAVRTDLARAVGGFPQPGTPEWPRPNVEDWGYLIRLLNYGVKFFHLPVTTWVWRIHSAHTGGQPDRDH